jgi:5'(3')-deoxyribonucleotidase
MTKPRVGVDVDGVLADFLTPSLQVASDMLGKAVTPQHMSSYDLEQLLPKHRIGEFWERMGAPGICRNLTPYPGAIEGVGALRLVADVFVITSYLYGAKQWVHDRDGWIMEHFGIPKNRMVHTHAKHVFSAKMLIDDKPENVEEWAMEHHGGTPVLWEQPYNVATALDSRVSYRVVRTDKWAHVIDIVKSWSGR